MLRVAGLVGALACAAIACDAHEAEGEDHGHEGEGEGHAGSATTAWISVRAAADASLIELPARIEGASASQAHLDASFRSIVVSASVMVGDRVEVGAEIVELRVPELLEAAAILSGANEQIGAHSKRRERLTDLRDKGLVGTNEVFDVERSLGALSAERRVALATLRAAGIDESERRELLRRGTMILRAPVAGVVAELDASPGEVVEPGESLARILGLGPARIEVVHSGLLPRGVGLEFVGLDGSRFALTDEPVATATEPGLGRTLAWYEAADGRALPDGVRGHVRVGGDASALLEVPRRALKLHEGKAFVARRPASGEGEPEAVEVEVLRSAGSSALVRGLGTSGALAIGDEVAADAATVLLIGREQGEVGGGHHH